MNIQGLSRGNQQQDLIPKANSVAGNKARTAVLTAVTQKLQGNPQAAVGFISKAYQKHSNSPEPWISMVEGLL